MVKYVVVVVYAGEKGDVDCTEDHTNVGTEGDESTEDGTREPISRYLDF